MIKRLGVFVSLCGILSFATAAPVIHFRVFTPSLSGSTSSRTITINATYSGPDLSTYDDVKAPLPLYRYQVTGPVQDNKIQEQNLLFAGIRYDLNGNGSFTDSFPLVLKKGPYAYLDGKKVLPVISGGTYGNLLLKGYGEVQDTTSVSLGKGSAFFLEYYRPVEKKASMLLGKQGSPVTLKEFPSPGILVEVINMVDGPGEKSSASLGGETFYSWSTTQYFESQAGGWVAIAWTVIPVNLIQGKKVSASVKVTGLSVPCKVQATGVLSLTGDITMTTRPIARLVTD